MATMNKFPPDMPKDWDEASDEIDHATNGLRAKAADVADKATETVRGGYSRAKDALTDIDPVETAREGGQAVIRAVERNPVVAFGLGALGIGLIAWASLRSPPASRWERYQPDFDRLRGLLGDYGKDAAKSGEGALRSSQQWLNAHGGDARDYAGYGGRMIAQRAQKEPIAAVLGIGLAVYALGSLLGSSNHDAAPARKRAAPKR